jgi:ATP/ADP translocase
VNARTVAASVLVCAVLVVGGKLLFDISWESALVLAPVFVLILGALAFLVVLWAKVIRDSLRS